MARPASDQNRNRLIAAVHAAKKSARLDDDSYRDTLERITAKRSAADCNDAELRSALDHLNSLAQAAKGAQAGKTRRRAEGPLVGKVTALWWSLHHLGVIDNPSDAALAAFLKRMAGVDALQWATADQLSTVIEALKDMAMREAGVDWSPFAPGRPRDPRLAVAEGQWRLLLRRGVPLPAASLHAFAFARTRRPLSALLPTDWTPLHQELGKLVRASRPAEAP